MKLTFEEKQYETQMNIELACDLDLHRNIFSPGQVLEGVLGFDAALHSCNKKFWKYFYKDFDYAFHKYLKYWRHGMPMKDMYELHEVFEKIYNNMPDIQYNVFIQYKRPKYLKKSTASEYWKWKRPYYRFNIVEHQQKLLENLSSKIGKNGLVIYVSPAFVTQGEFWSNVNNKTLVENSAFCKADELKSHHKYTYIEGGKRGVAFSEPEEVDKIDIKQELRMMKEKRSKNDNIRNNSEYIKKLSNDIEEVILESPYVEYYKDRFITNYNSEISNIDSYIVKSLLKIKTFEEVTGINVINGY